MLIWWPTAYSVVLFPAILPDEAVLEPGEHQDSQIYERPVSKQEQVGEYESCAAQC